MDIPHGYRPLPGSERPQVPGAQFLEDVEPAEHIGFTIRMRSRPGASAEPGLDHWQNTPAHRRHFLSTEEHMRRHGAAQEDVEAIALFLKSHNLGVIEADAGRRRIVVEGTAANINRAFAITLKRYRAPQRHLPRPTPKLNEPDAAHVTIREHEHRGYDGPIHLPADLVGVITAVIGLDNRMVGAPAATGTGDPSSSIYLSPEVVGQTYNFPNTGAVGQTVGIFEDAASGAAYLHADITSFINSLPSGFNTLPVLSDIGLTVGATTYSNNTALVTSSPTSAVGECCIDVSIVAAIVQGGNINVYFTENTEAGWEAFLNRAIFPLPGDNAPSVLSASWLLSFGDDAGSIGDPSASGSIAHVISGLLQSAATRGITVFMAIGDWGSANQVLDGKCHVSYPNCDPWSTACGGTIIGNIATTPTRFQEFVWSDANIAASPFQFFPFVSTGGGVSDNFPVPAYQTAILDAACPTSPA
jgi:subtilase family serine protease